jgi:hypothetical protein
MALKKEYGARLAPPLASQDEIHPMGRGTTSDVISWYRSRPEISAGSMTRADPE